MFHWQNVFKGMLMGISDVIPGVSGGTIALVLGIYQRLVAAINGILSKDWKKHIAFLIPIGIGIGIAVLTFSHIMEWLLAEYPEPTFFFFLGLIIGIIPMLLKEVNYKKTFKTNHYILFAIAAVLVAITVLIKENEMAAVMSELVWSDYLFLFIGGWLASSAMILPGISGSFVLLLLGLYPTVINAVSTLNISVIMTVGFGVVIGLLLTSKLIAFLFVKYRIATYAVMIGFVAGSIVVIYPGFGSNLAITIASIIAFLFGLLASYLLSIIENKKLEPQTSL